MCEYLVDSEMHCVYILYMCVIIYEEHQHNTLKSWFNNFVKTIFFTMKMKIQSNFPLFMLQPYTDNQHNIIHMYILYKMSHLSSMGLYVYTKQKTVSLIASGVYLKY